MLIQGNGLRIVSLGRAGAKWAPIGIAFVPVAPKIAEFEPRKGLRTSGRTAISA
jgi:hypothetical protein